MKLMKSCARFLRKHGGTLLAIGASVGVVLTAIETGKATIKAEKLVELNKDVPEYDMKEKVKDCWHFYIPAAVLGAGTIGCIIGSNMLSRKEIASLSAAYVALGKSYQQYRRQVAERIGTEEEEKLRMEAAKETKAEDVQRDKDGDVIRLFYEPASKRYFHATMSKVIEASYYFNRELATNGCISVNEWCNYLCADELTITPEGDQMGWCIDQLIYDWDAYWMDFEYDKHKVLTLRKTRRKLKRFLLSRCSVLVIRLGQAEVKHVLRLPIANGRLSKLEQLRILS